MVVITSPTSIRNTYSFRETWTGDSLTRIEVFAWKNWLSRGAEFICQKQLSRVFRLFYPLHNKVHSFQSGSDILECSIAGLAKNKGNTWIITISMMPPLVVKYGLAFTTFIDQTGSFWIFRTNREFAWVQTASYKGHFVRTSDLTS